MHPPAEHRPPPPRYESLDVWRGAACLSVVAFHATVGYVATPDLDARVRAEGGSFADWCMVACARMWVGVPIFFAVSGYCVSAAADAARGRPRPWARFLWRRARRIYPPLWILLALAAAGVALLPDIARPGPAPGVPEPLPHPADVPAWSWVGSLTLTEEWRPYLIGPDRGYFSGHVWTLCYEEQFYLVVGAALLLAPRRLFAVLAVVTTAVFLNVFDFPKLLPTALAARAGAWQCAPSGFFFDGQWLSFAAGAAAYYRAAHCSPMGKLRVDLVLVAGLVWAAGHAGKGFDFRATLPGMWVVAASTALLLGWLRPFDAALSRTWCLAPVRACGRMCYSLYLVHAPIACLVSWNLFRAGVRTTAETLFFTLPAVLLLSVVAGYAFHVAVERRFLNAPGPRPA